MIATDAALNTARIANPTVLTMAATILRRERAAWAAYREECDAQRAQGYRPSHCRHGVYLWVEWDAICGPCEDGAGYWEYTREASDAIARAQRAWDLYTAGIAALASVRGIAGDPDGGTLSAYFTLREAVRNATIARYLP
jgi:hypothetical protein